MTTSSASYVALRTVTLVVAFSVLVLGLITFFDATSRAAQFMNRWGWLLTVVAGGLMLLLARATRRARAVTQPRSDGDPPG